MYVVCNHIEFINKLHVLDHFTNHKSDLLK